MNFSLVGIIVPDFPESRNVEAVCKDFGGKTINFYTMDMEELSLIAKHRVLPVPTILIFAPSGKVVGRIVKEIPSADAVEDMLRRIEE